MKNLILLEGGSYRGIYTSGVLDVFMEHDIYPDCAQKLIDAIPTRNRKEERP